MMLASDELRSLAELFDEQAMVSFLQDFDAEQHSKFIEIYVSAKNMILHAIYSIRTGKFEGGHEEIRTFLGNPYRYDLMFRTSSLAIIFSWAEADFALSISDVFFFH